MSITVRFNVRTLSQPLTPVNVSVCNPVEEYPSNDSPEHIVSIIVFETGRFTFKSIFTGVIQPLPSSTSTE